MLAPLATSPLATSRPCNLATSPVEPSSFQPPNSRVPEMRDPTLCSATCPYEPRLLGASWLDILMCLGSLALHDSASLCATCTPLMLHYGPHCSSYQDIAISRPRDILWPNSRTFSCEVPRHDPSLRSNGPPVLWIQWLSFSRHLATSRLGIPNVQTLEPASSRVSKISLISHHLSSSNGWLRSSHSFVTSCPRVSRL
jgi:hypothetical protein